MNTGVGRIIRRVLTLGLSTGCMLFSRGRAGAAVLPLLPQQTPKPNYGVPVPPAVSGRVIANGEGVAEVSVTDGYAVVKTDARGAYTLTPSTNAVFINITKPAGYAVLGDWYKPVAPVVDFTLKAAQDENEYTFVHVTDTHTHSSSVSLEGLSSFVREVNAMSPALRFVLNSGDLVSLSKSLDNPPSVGRAWFGNYVGIMNHLSIPYYNVAGDHTDSSYRIEEFPRGDFRCAKAMYWEHMGPNFYSFEYGRIHFVSVDFTYHLGKRQIQGKEYPSNGVQPVHVEWMQQDMANRAKDSFVVTTSESDLARFCPGFVDMATQYDVRLQLTGDDHVVAYQSHPVPYRTGGSLSGCWWLPKTKGLCPDGSPSGYMIYRVRGAEMECFYKGLGQRVAITSHRIGAPWQGKVNIEAHLVQPKPDEALEYSFNGKDWQAMRETGRPFYRATYEAGINSASLPDGLLDFRVRNAADGEVRLRTFVIANGRTPAPAGGDATLSFKVPPANNMLQYKGPDGNVDVLFNDRVVGVLAPKAKAEYTFRIPGADLNKANVLSFRFAQPHDDMGISAPALAIGEQVFRDPRYEFISRIRVGHPGWGAKSVGWGGFIAGDGHMQEGPFTHKQDVFCFVLPGTGIEARPLREQ